MQIQMELKMGSLTTLDQFLLLDPWKILFAVTKSSQKRAILLSIALICERNL